MNVASRALRSRPLVTLAIAALVFVLVITLRLAGLLEPLELGAYDRFLRGSPRSPMPDTPIVLIRIHEEDIRRFGHPLCDDLLHQALRRLMAAEPRVIGVDLYRDAPVPHCKGSAPRDRSDRAYTALAADVNESDRIVMIMKFPDERDGGVSAPDFLQGASRVGFSDISVDPGGAVRRGLLLLWDGETQYLSFSLRLALRYLGADRVGLERDPVDPRHLRLGKTTIPPFEGNDGGYVGADDGGYQFLLDYKLGSNAFLSFSLGELLSGAIAPEAMRDKIVIVGTTAPSVKDHFYTPYSQVLREDQAMYGIEVHAHAVDQLLRYASGEDRPLASLSQLEETVWILLWALLGAGLALWNRSWWLSPLAALGGVGVLALGGYALFARGWWIPVVPAALAAVGAAGVVTAYVAVVERAERIEVRRLFSRFLRPKVADEIWRQRDQFMRKDASGQPESQRATLTVLMSDLRGYTSAAEKMEPDALMHWLNEYMNAMASLVERHGGVVDDYIGDGLKANFGFPVPRSSDVDVDADAINAVRCAIAMGREMERLEAMWRHRKLPTPRMRIGIFTGPAVVGALGSEQSLKYTSVGDTVNTAARLESFDKDGFRSDPSERAWRILIGEDTMRRLGGAFRTIDLGRHALEGKSDLVHIYRVLGLADPDSDEPREGRER